jgi:dolichol-phosphate mannosyltransferase
VTRRGRASLVYAVLALAVAGPLLAPGLVLTVDLSPVPHPHLAGAYWGLPEGTHEGALDRLPIDALFVALGHLGLVAAGQKLLLLGIVFLAGLGMHRAAPARTEAGRYFAGLLYAVNPFVYDRLQAGQWYLLLGYALLPWAFRSFGRLLEGDWRSAWRFAAIAIALGVASAHMAMLLALLCSALTAAALVDGRVSRRRVLGSVSLGAALAVLPSVYWLLPTPGIRDLWRHVGAAQLDFYRTVPDTAVGLGGTVAGLYGFWNNPEPVKAHLSSWPVLAVCLVALALWGLRRQSSSPTAWAVAVTGAVALLLAMGTDGPTGSLYTWLLEHVEPARSFREPQKLVALLVFAYAYLGAGAVDDLRERTTGLPQHAPALGLVCALALPVVYGYRELGVLWGSLSTSHYPTSWQEAKAVLDRDARSSRTLFLPWHGYLGLSFAGGRGVANPAPSYFDTPILASRSVGDANASDNSDPVETYVGDVLGRASQLTDLGACLAPLGVSHVLVAKEADYRAYDAVARQRDLVLERSWPDLALYRSTVPTSLVLGARDPVSGTSCTEVARHLRPLPAANLDPAHVELGAVPASTQTIVLTAPFRSDWTLGGVRSTSFSGIANSFPASAASARTITLSSWGDYRRNYLLGLVGILAFAASWLVAARRRPEEWRALQRPPLVDPRVWVVLPTYNEVENVAPMVRALLDVFARSGLKGTVLVVDDASPDGTGAIASRLALESPAVRVLHRAGKEGLGRAYTAGFAVALEHGADLVVEMDCDFSHDPADVPRLVSAAAHADLVLGSRYVRGGATENWSLGRRVISRSGSLYARTILGVHVRDLTGGFKCFRRETLLALESGTASAAGYGFQIELTYRALKRGLRVVELPIEFRERRAGSSKMSGPIVLEAMLLVPRLRLAGGEASASSEDIGDGTLHRRPDGARRVPELASGLVRGEPHR